MSFEWENGRILKKINTSDKSVQMSYDSNGMRTQKSVDGVKTNYYYDSNKNLIALVKGNDTLLFYYDSDGNATSFSYNGTMYFYVKNLQGDVVRIIDLSGTEVASYVYDAWGNIKDTKGEPKIREINPIRYRGYVYDTETSLYYLQSRYYDPFTGRFLNADVYCDTNTGTPLSTNIFAYCENNPISNADESGYIAANVIGAVIGGIVGAVGGYFLTNWLADKLNLHGWKRNVFVWGLSAVIGAAAAVIGYFIGPYVAKLATKLASYVANLIQKGKVAIAKLTNTIRNKSGITKLIVKNLVKNASKLKYTKTAASHLHSRPYMKSTHIIKNIMQAANPVADKSLKYGLKWVVKGSYNGTKGIWELVIDVSKKRIVHFLFKKG